MITSFKFKLLIIIFNIRVYIRTGLNTNKLHFDYSMIRVITFMIRVVSTRVVSISFNLSMYTFFEIEVKYLQILFFNVSEATDFTLLCVE